MRTAFALLLVFVTTTGCTQSKPLVTPSFIGIQKIPHFYQIQFASDVALSSIFDEKAGEKVVSNRLLCALEDDQNFSVGRAIERTLTAELPAAPQPVASSAGRFVYEARANFYENADNESSRRLIPPDPLRSILLKRESIACKVVMTVYLKKPYYSAAMYIPTSAILKELPVSPAK